MTPPDLNEAIGQNLWGWMPVINTLAICALSVIGYGWRSAVRKVEKVEAGIQQLLLAMAAANTAVQVLAAQFAAHTREDEHAFRNLDARMNAQRQTLEAIALGAGLRVLPTHVDPVTGTKD